MLGIDPLAAAACAGVTGLGTPTGPISEAEKAIIEGRELLSKNRAKRAIQKFRRATRLAPEFAPAWNDLGVAIYKTGKPRQAIRYFLQSLENDPSFVDATMNLAQIFQELEQPADAIPYLKRLQDLEPGNQEARKLLIDLEPVAKAAATAEALTEKGRAHVVDKSYKEALLAFIEATHAYPGCVPAWNDLGVTLYQTGQPEAALEAFQRALQLDPTFSDSALNMASLYANANCHAKGIAPLQRALAEDPENEEVANALDHLTKEIKVSNRIEKHIFDGRDAMRNGDLTTAIKEYRGAIQIDDGCYIAHNDLGVALWSARQPLASIASLKKALSAQPGFIDAAINLASIFAALDRHKEAIPFLTEAAGIHPDCKELQVELERFAPENIVQHQIEVLVQRGREFVDQNQLDQAIQCFIAATELDNNCAAAWSDLGVALAASDQIVTGIEAFERALRANPGFAEAALNLATVYANLERYDSSVAILERVLEEQPQNSDIVELLQGIQEELS